MGPVGKAQQFHLMLIPIDQPFNLTHTLECGQAFRWRREGDWYYGVIYGNILKIRQTLLGVEFNSFPLPEEEIVNRLAYYLRLDDDLPEIYRIIGRDDRMRHAIAQYFGLRLLRQEPWECLVSFICSISSNIPRISQSIESLCGKMGDRLEMDGHVRFSFPGPEKVMELGETGLRLMGMGFRAPYLADTADRIGRGVYDLEGFAGAQLRRRKEGPDDVIRGGGQGGRLRIAILPGKAGLLSHRQVGQEGGGGVVLGGREPFLRCDPDLGPGLFWGACGLRPAVPFPRAKAGKEIG